jgi:hypothetical protein
MEAEIREEYAAKMAEAGEDPDEDGSASRGYDSGDIGDVCTVCVSPSYIIKCILHSLRARSSNHWSKRITAKNPRGYTKPQLQQIAKAPTLSAKMKVELDVMATRLSNESHLLSSLDDEYGQAAIVAMSSEIRAEYAAKVAKGDESDEDSSDDDDSTSDRYESADT